VKPLTNGHITSQGLVEFEPTVLETPSWDEAAAQAAETDGIKIIPELVRGIKLTHSSKLYAWSLLVPNQGYELLMTDNALKQLKQRITTTRQPSCTKLPTIEANIDYIDYGNGGSEESGYFKVAIGIMSDRFGFFGNEDLIKRTEHVVGSFADCEEISLASFSPEMMKLSVILGREYIGGDDEVTTGVTLWNSHCGMSSIAIANWAERVICTNGLSERVLGKNSRPRRVTTRHVTNGMRDWWLRKLQRSGAMFLSKENIDYLTRHVRQNLDYRVDDKIIDALKAEWKVSKEIVHEGQLAFDKDFTLKEYQDRVYGTLDLLDEERQDDLMRALGIKWDKTLKTNLPRIRRAVTRVMPKIADSLGTNGWALANAFNCQPELKEFGVVETARDWMKELGSCIVREMAQTTH
jgi:hypothetical protein